MSLCVNEKKATSAPDKTNDKKSKKKSTMTSTVVPCACIAESKWADERNPVTG
jgi:hypothetical protein